MEPQVQRRLLALNRQFYERFAQPFACSRSPIQASMRHVVRTIPHGAAVLDVGCGDGRAARALDAAGTPATYTGVDGSQKLIDLARARSDGLTSVQASFALADVTEPGWSLGLGARAFDAVLYLAVLHHIPGSELRLQIVRDMAGLLRPGGRLIVSTWQFLSSDRLRRKVVPWSAAGLLDSDVDEGDYLLDWQRGGSGLRYCRMIAEPELRGLCTAAGLVVQESYLADNGLNLFVVAGKAA